MFETRIVTADPWTVEADGLAIGLFEASEPETALLGPLFETLQRVRALGDFAGKRGDTLLLYPEGTKVPRVVVVGLGKATDFTLDQCRKAAGLAARKLRDAGARRIVVIPCGSPSRFDWSVAASAAIEGAMLANYRMSEYKTTDRESEKDLSEVIIAAPPAADSLEPSLVERSRDLVRSVNWVRTMVNQPGNRLTSLDLERQALEMAHSRPITCEVLTLEELRAMGMGCLVGVNAGSAQPARMIVLQYRGAPPSEHRRAPLAIVGKGVTFDSGGVCIKPKAGMEQMKDDMSGGGAVLGALRAAADLELPVDLVGIVPATDNMPGSKAVKPGDILRSFGGLTVEVIDTDAEGRMILADGLAYAAKKFRPRAIVSIATLTGSVYVALGHGATGLFTNADRLVPTLTAAGETTGEKVWHLPLWPEHEEQIESQIADVKNAGEKGESDGIAAAAFLKRFVGDIPWAHLDIAGTSWAEEDQPYVPKGATGVGVRLLVEALRRGL